MILNVLVQNQLTKSTFDETVGNLNVKETEDSHSLTKKLRRPRYLRCLSKEEFVKENMTKLLVELDLKSCLPDVTPSENNNSVRNGSLLDDKLTFISKKHLNLSTPRRLAVRVGLSADQQSDLTEGFKVDLLRKCLDADETFSKAAL